MRWIRRRFVTSCGKSTGVLRPRRIPIERHFEYWNFAFGDCMLDILSLGFVCVQRMIRLDPQRFFSKEIQKMKSRINILLRECLKEAQSGFRDTGNQNCMLENSSKSRVLVTIESQKINHLPKMVDTPESFSNAIHVGALKPRETKSPRFEGLVGVRCQKRFDIRLTHLRGEIRSSMEKRFMKPGEKRTDDKTSCVKSLPRTLSSTRAKPSGSPILEFLSTQYERYRASMVEGSFAGDFCEIAQRAR